MKQILPLLLAFSAGIAVGWFLARPGSGPRERSVAEAPPAETHETRLTLEALQRLDQRMVHALELLEAASGPRPTPSMAPEGGRAPRDSGTDEERALLRELRAGIETLLERSSDARAGLQQARRERPDADWSALDPLLALWEVDVERARKQVLLLSEVEVVRRYGSPDLTFPDGRGARWVYGQGFVPERDAYRLQIVFAFQDGLVQSFYVERL